MKSWVLELRNHTIASSPRWSDRYLNEVLSIRAQEFWTVRVSARYAIPTSMKSWVLELRNLTPRWPTISDIRTSMKSWVLELRNNPTLHLVGRCAITSMKSWVLELRNGIRKVDGQIVGTHLNEVLSIRAQEYEIVCQPYAAGSGTPQWSPEY